MSSALALTPAELAPIIRQHMRDKRYRSTALGVLVDRYVRWFRNEWGATPDTIRDYKGILARMALTLGDKDPAELDVEDLREFIALWSDRSPRTRAKVTSVVRSFWAWAEEQGIVEHSPAAKIRRPRTPKKRPRLLPADADARLLDTSRSPRDRVALGCLLWLGIRRSELAGVQVRDFDLARRTLRVYGKGQKERSVPLRGPVVDEIAFYLQEELPHVGRPPEPDDFLLYPTRRVYAGRGSEGEQRHQVRGYPKKRPSVQYVHRWWYRQLEASGFVGRGVTSGLNMHRARHTFAQAVRRASHDLGAVQHILGHSDPSTTIALYGGYEEQDLEAAMEAYVAAQAGEDEGE